MGKQPPYPGFQVGKVNVQVPLLLAPMEDVTNSAFRLIAKRIANPGLMFTEFVSAMAIHYNAQKTFAKMKIFEGERPLGIQIFGADPKIMAETAKVAEDQGADIIDINMGCWVPKVVRTGSGAALLKEPDVAEEVVREVVKAVHVPVTVKVRAGYTYSHFAAPELAKRFEGAGAKMLTLHARFAKQGFEGQADWDLIKQLRGAISIPLIGNGDVKTAEDSRKMMDETGCDGIMVGRAAISNPWQLAQIRSGLTGEPTPNPPTLQERVEIALEHCQLMVAHGLECESYEEAKKNQDFDEMETRLIRSLRGQIPLYIKGYPGSAKLRSKLSQVSSVQDVREILEPFAQEFSEENQEPILS